MPYEKVGNNEPVCIADEVPFEIPESWEWVRLGSISTVITKGTTPRGGNVTYLKSGIGFLRAENVTGMDYLDTNKMNYINEETHTGYLKRSILFENDILITIAGTLGRTALVRKKDLPLNANQAVAIVRVLKISEFNLLYLIYAINSPLIQKRVTKQKKITAIPNLTLEIISNCCVPIPPIKEQHRIVAKIDKILSYIKEYNDKEERLNTLNIDFPDKLKKSILQQAVQGKLVPQNLADEPASILLERIREEKKKLIAEGKIKKDKHESVIFRRDNSHYEIMDGVERCIDDEIPFEIPSSWEWVRLGSIGETAIGLTYKPNDKTDKENGTAVLRSNNIQNDKMNYDNLVYVSCNVPKRAIINKGEILICARNGSRALVGKAAIVNAEGMAFGAFMAKYTSMLSGTLNPYIMTFIESPVFRNQLDGVKTVTINQVTQDMLKLQLIPLPPLAEQYRIVKKLEEVLSTIKSIQV